MTTQTIHADGREVTLDQMRDMIVREMQPQDIKVGVAYAHWSLLLSRSGKVISARLDSCSGAPIFIWDMDGLSYAAEWTVNRCPECKDQLPDNADSGQFCDDCWKKIKTFGRATVSP